MIYDCFPFFNELDIIEIRFKELYNVVDYFVVCESNLTHSGNPKPLYFETNKERFAPFMDKIIHLVCNDPGEPEPGHDINWTRERNQRNFIYNTLKNRCNDDDIIINTDADEIFNSSKIDELKQIDYNCYAIEMRSSWYYLNLVCNPRWTTGKAIRFKSLRDNFKGNLSLLRVSGAEKAILEAGWHLSYMGGYDRVKQKLESFAHQEFNKPDVTCDEHIKLVVRFGSSIWDEFKEIAPRGNVPYWYYDANANLPTSAKDPVYAHLVSKVNFTALNYDGGNLYHMFNLAKEITGEGEVIDIGCAEGRTSIYLANALPNNQIHCVDLIINEQFHKNMEALTNGNFVATQEDALTFLRNFDKPIKVLHLDACYDSEFLTEALKIALPKMTQSYLICGYDWNEEGTKQAIQTLGDVGTSGKFWFQRRLLVFLVN